MYTKIGIPENNSLKSKIEELYEWCDKRDNDDELGKTYFNEPIDEDKLNKSLIRFIIIICFYYVMIFSCTHIIMPQ